MRDEPEEAVAVGALLYAAPDCTRTAVELPPPCFAVASPSLALLSKAAVVADVAANSSGEGRGGDGDGPNLLSTAPVEAVAAAADPLNSEKGGSCCRTPLTPRLKGLNVVPWPPLTLDDADTPPAAAAAATAGAFGVFVSAAAAAAGIGAPVDLEGGRLAAAAAALLLLVPPPLEDVGCAAILFFSSFAASRNSSASSRGSRAGSACRQKLTPLYASSACTGLPYLEPEGRPSENAAAVAVPPPALPSVSAGRLLRFPALAPLDVGGNISFTMAFSVGYDLR